MKVVNCCSPCDRDRAEAQSPRDLANGGPCEEEVRRTLINLLFGKQTYEALEIGRYRLEGEVHQWMYDRFSLARLLLVNGFIDPTLMQPETSQIEGWIDYHLEVGEDGTVHKPDSFVMEARKPA